MYKIYLPITRQEKSSIHGLWRDNGKTYHDNIQQVNRDTFNKSKAEYFCIKYNQLALFFTGQNDTIGYCYTQRTQSIETYNKRLIVKHNQKAGLKDLIKKYLTIYGGLTIYKEVNGYIIEVYHNEQVLK